ncbi:hypothetical protein Ae201684P_017758 [Aphanomyces euteiches]|nr:hypothetical protein Ae201684P_017758 [Aphanomyces euteiches]
MRFAVLALVFAAVAFVSGERAVDDSSAAHSTYQQSGDSLVQNHAESPPVQEQAAAGASQEFAGEKVLATVLGQPVDLLDDLFEVLAKPSLVV